MSRLTEPSGGFHFFVVAGKTTKITHTNFQTFPAGEGKKKKRGEGEGGRGRENLLRIVKFCQICGPKMDRMGLTTGGDLCYNMTKWGKL